jgi:hypothetical protein
MRDYLDQQSFLKLKLNADQVTPEGQDYVVNRVAARQIFALPQARGNSKVVDGRGFKYSKCRCA